MQEPFTNEFLGTIAGAAAATTLIVELIKDLKPVKRCPTRWIVIAVAETITILTTWLNGQFAWNKLLPCFLNGLVVASTAMAGWHVTQIGKSTTKKESEK
ncbi:hypothetical protein [Candidatus Formimonas warabiya]|uniref:Holin n=1 Tax=Formimonas warabiya TaxID=1761012 RepID=A0A3G1L0I8_FORW1|nr:hypothetical protein [Candidatus Formimonas warabiya]ATW28180.1 hypothetical protein DCMF_28545 [Candidatus Formimonas warabiya]